MISMRVAIAFAFFIVLISWSTAPLAIKWSNLDFSPAGASAARMTLAALSFSLLAWMLRKPLKIANLPVYIAGAAGLIPSTLLAYYGANYVNSAVIAIVNGVSPFVTAFASILILRENPFNLLRVLGATLSVLGLLVIFQEQLSWREDAWIGVLLVLISSISFAVSSVVVRRLYHPEIDILEHTAGVHLITAPVVLLAWWIEGAHLPEAPGWQSIGAIIYLGLVISIFGSLAYNWMLRHASLATVVMIPLVVPLLALYVGRALGREPLTGQLLMGTLMIVCALALYEWSRLGKALRQGMRALRRRVSPPSA